MKRGVTIPEALTEQAAAKIEIESMQQLVLKDKLLSSKEEKLICSYISELGIL